jgi:anti-sigma factor ChrR (cupin superfamily)
MELRETTEAAAALALAAPFSAPPESLRARVLNTVSGVRMVRAGTNKWKQIAPGVTATCLHFDRGSGQMTSLLKMQPGASYGKHRHSAPEQCYVIEGDVFDGRNRFQAGDYEYLDSGTVHSVQSTENGCLLLIISNIHDELIPG